MAFSRRQFIQVSGGALGGAALASGLTTRWWGLDPSRMDDPGTEGDHLVPGCCESCFWGCGVLAHVKGGRVTKVVGNPAHPLSRGMLCPRGAGVTGQLYDPDRLTRPLLRTRSKRGDDIFEAVDWKTALDFTASRLDEVRKKYGPEALALFTHGCGGSWFSAFMKAYGSANVGMPSYAQCRGPREAGYGLTFGTGLASPEPIDIGYARCITFIGAHLGENMHNTQVQELADAVGSGAQLVVVDPRYSVAAGKARYWLPIKPGTDIALLLAWMNVILEERRTDADYLAKYAIGLDELKAHVADKTPEWAWPITGIRPEKIRETARFISAFRPASLIHPGRHTTWYGDDTQRARAMAILAALLGNWGRRGGYIHHTKLSIAPYPAPKFEIHPKPPADKPKGGGYPFSDEVLASGLRAATIPGTAAYDIKAWIVYGSNLIQTLPNRAETEKAIEHLDLLVAVDILPSEIVGWADVVFPEAHILERYDEIAAPAYKRPYAGLRLPAVQPLGDSKPGWWMVKELANRLDLGRYFPWKDAEEYLRTRIAASGLDWNEVVKTGVVLGKMVPICEEEGLPIGAFATPSKKIELYSEQMKTAGFDPLPVYYPQEEPPPGMLRLLTGRAPMHTFGRTTNNRLLAEPYPENDVWVNSITAQAQSVPIKNGDYLMLVNQDGAKSGPVRAKVTERIRGDCVYLVHGWGHTAKKLSYAFGRGASTSELTTRYKVDPLMGGTGMNVNFVRLEPAARAS